MLLGHILILASIPIPLFSTMPPQVEKPPENVRCVCTAFGCSGKPGGYWFVDRRTLKIHEEEEDKRLIAAAIEEHAAEREELEKQREAVKKQQEELAAIERSEKQKEREMRELEKTAVEARVDVALEELKQREDDDLALFGQLPAHSVVDPVPEVSGTPRYRMDQERKLASVMGKLIDLQDALWKEVEMLRLPATEMRLSMLTAGLNLLDNFMARAQTIRRDLKLLQYKRRSESIKTMGEEAMATSKLLFDNIRAAEKRWTAAVEKEQESLSSSDAVKYSTGMYVRLSTSYDFEPIIDHLFGSILPNALIPVQIIAYMVTVCSVLLMFSRRGCSWLLAMSRVAIDQSFELAVGSQRSRTMNSIVDTFPKDPPTVIDKFRLDSKCTTYAVCPSCHHLYPPISTDPIPVYRERCNYRRYDRGAKCTELLCRPTTSHGILRYVPIKPFVSFDFKDWLAKLLARPDMEKAMDEKWKELKRPPSEMTPEEVAAEELTDIFDGHLIREFKGPDGKKHFSVPSEEGEGRYLFSLGFDNFNPLTNKQAGKKLSVGVFSLVCLNLPVEDRYKPENMFLAGIIPGPKEPPRDHTNSYWTPLVDCLEELWTRGVLFNRTGGYPSGRLVRCALVAVVCDTLAARKIGGFASCCHEWFCTRCLCTRPVKKRRTQPESHRRRYHPSRPDDDGAKGSETSHSAHFEGGDGNRVGYNDYATHTWRRRTNEGTRKAAEKYRRAPTEKLAQHYFDHSGLRWTEFLRLPYFDLTTMLVIDSMHNLFLGLLKEHFRNILGFISKDGPKTKSKSETPTTSPALEIVIEPSKRNPLPKEANQRASLEKAIKILQQPMNRRLQDESERQKISRSLEKMHLPSAIYLAKGLSCSDLYKVKTDPNGAVKVTGKTIKKSKIIDKILDWVSLHVIHIFLSPHNYTNSGEIRWR